MAAPIRSELAFTSGNELLVGDLVTPAGRDDFPTVVFLAGTGAIDRFQRGVLPGGEIRDSKPRGWLTDGLARMGVAVFAWDKRGVGASTGGNRRPGDPPGDRDSHASVQTDVDDALAALEAVSQLPQVNERRITVMGHSAGVYFASLLAARTDLPTSYVLWGGVYQDIVDLMDFIYGQAIDYASRGPEEYAFIQKHSPALYATGLRRREIVEAARRGDATYRWEHDGQEHVQHLARLSQEIAWPLGDQFRNIRKPVLVIHGDRDLNVTCDDAFEIMAALQSAGNDEATLVIVPGADHGMRVAPRNLDAETRLRERLSFHKGRPVSSFFMHSVAGWILDQALLDC